MTRLDRVHFGLMLAAFGLAYALPFELVLAAYATLGPPHYLTEISWLHGRGYFLPSRWLAAVLIGFCVPAFFLFSAPWFGLVLWIAILGAALATARSALACRAVIAVLGTALGVAMLAQPSALYFIAIILPSLVHVIVFTTVFMAIGASRANGSWQWGLLAAYLAMIGLILVAPPDAAALTPASLDLDRTYFGNIAAALGILAGSAKWPMDGRLTGLLSFVYTYHYLNWFIKSEAIGWHRVSWRRLAVIASLASGMIGLYFVDFALGITVLLAVSLAHVVLEFPLNMVSLRQLAAIGRRSLSRREPGRSEAAD